MKCAKYPEVLVMAIGTDAKGMIANIATEEHRSMSEVARELIEAGMEAKGIIA